MVSKINRYNLRNQPDNEYVVSILNKLDECIDLINKGFDNPTIVERVVEKVVEKPVEKLIENQVELIRLGSIVVHHIKGIHTDIIGTTKLQNSNTYYVPIADMKIISSKWITNITTTDIPSTPLGTLKIISAAFVNSILKVQEIIQSINTDFVAVGLNNQAMYDTVSETPNMTLKAFESNYAIQVILDASAPTGAYAFEVYIKAEYV